MTSANRTGEADDQLVDLDLAVKQVGDRVDYILDGEAQDTTQSSTILDCSREEPAILRHGDITADDLTAAVDGLA
jgi:L-threonylcarbamoyladenylate synthase